MGARVGSFRKIARDGLLAIVLVATFGVRAIELGQPIVENYVGRQVPTAMVARNLERGSGPLHPRLDTAPWPNYFLVEPPLYQLGVVAIRRVTRLGLEPSGRLLSAMATVAATWGIFVLTARGAGRRAGLLAAGAFAAFPLTIRYGRAFQPDAAMLGAVVAGLACWDHRRYAGGWVLLAIGIAMKILVAPLIMALALTAPRGRRRSLMVATATAVLPVMLWYAWAAHLVAAGSGSRASADNGAIWIGMLVPESWLRADSWRLAARFAAIRSFTPIGTVLAAAGLIVARRRAGFWRAWGLAGSFLLILMISKIHHEYYFLIVAPAFAVGTGLALDRIARVRGGRVLFPMAAVGMLAMAGWQSRGTWRTPPEWSGLAEAARAVEASTGPGACVVAPEALLFAADRRGCRLEWTEPAARRAAGEWGEAGVVADVRGPIDLVDFYRSRGARYFADLGDRRDDPRRLALHEAVRQRYKVIIDRPEVLIVDLESVPLARVLPHAN